MEVILSNKISSLLKKENYLRKKFSIDVEITFFIVVDVLKNADSLYDVPDKPPTRRHKLTGDMKNYWAIDFNKKVRLIIEPLNKDIDLKKIKSIKILDITNYH